MVGKVVLLFSAAILAYMLWEQLVLGMTYERKSGHTWRVPISRESQPLKFWGTVGLLVALITVVLAILIHAIISN